MLDLLPTAQAHRWHTARTPGDGSELGDPYVPGRRGQLWQDGARWGLTIQATPRIWLAVRDAARTAGFQITQNGDAEGAATFDPTPANLRLAARLIRVRAKRAVSPEAAEAFRQRMAMHRESRQDVSEALVGGGITPQNRAGTDSGQYPPPARHGGA